MNEGTDNGFVHTRSPSALCCRCFFERLKAVVPPFHKERRSEHMYMVTVGMTKAKAEKKKKTKRKKAVRKQLLANGQGTDRGHWKARRWAACRPPKPDITTDGVLQLLLSLTAVCRRPVGISPSTSSMSYR
jgi:hypothetical protein